MDDTSATITIISRFRAVPASSSILVSPGTVVEPDTPVARVETLLGKLWRVNVARDLRIPPQTAPTRLAVRPGESVSAGDPVAVGGAFFNRLVSRSPVDGVLALVSKNRGIVYVREKVETGSSDGPVEVPVADMLGVPPLAMMVYKAEGAAVGLVAVRGQVLARRGKTMVTAPVYGRITNLSTVKGTITLKPLFRTQTISAYMKGVVTRIDPAEGVEVSGRATVIRCIWGLGGESHGPIRVLSGDLTEESQLEEGSVVVANGTATYEALLHASESGVKGVILGWLRSGVAMRFAGGMKNMGVTGDEPVPFPVILTEGFLPQPMRDGVLRTLTASQGLMCSLNGSTHIRAGVVRPEIVIYPD